MKWDVETSIYRGIELKPPPSIFISSRILPQLSVLSVKSEWGKWDIETSIIGVMSVQFCPMTISARLNTFLHQEVSSNPFMWALNCLIFAQRPINSPNDHFLTSPWSNFRLLNVVASCNEQFLSSPWNNSYSSPIDHQEYSMIDYWLTTLILLIEPTIIQHPLLCYPFSF